MELLMELRNAAMVCKTAATRKALRAIADRLDLAIQDFCRTPTTYNLTALNGIWATAARVARTIPPEGGPSTPKTDSVDGPDIRERKAA